MLIDVLKLLPLLLITMLMGYMLLNILGIQSSIVKIYMYGFFLTWALLQLISVPLILIKASFTTLLIVYYLILFLFFVYYFKKYGISFDDFKVKTKLNIDEKIFVCLLLVVMCAFMFFQFSYQHVDEDDSRFIVNTVDIVDTNKLFLTNPATGEAMVGFTLSDSDKDIVSPFALYFAIINKITGIRIVRYTHTYFPLAMILLAVCVWWLFAEKLVGNNIVYQSMFVIILLLFHMFGSSFRWTEISMFMTRIWQGKAIVSSIGIPATFVTLFDYYKNSDLKHYLLILVVNLGACFLSGMGVVINAIIIAGFAIGYGFIKRDIKVFIYIAAAAIFNFIYYLLEINI